MLETRRTTSRTSNLYSPLVLRMHSNEKSKASISSLLNDDTQQSGFYACKVASSVWTPRENGGSSMELQGLEAHSILRPALHGMLQHPAHPCRKANDGSGC